jgi:hypothetical protein
LRVSGGPPCIREITVILADVHHHQQIDDVARRAGGEERGPCRVRRETCICAIAMMRSAVVGALEFVPSGSVR